MPYPSEHAARIIDPSKFIQNSFRRKNVADGIDIIVGKLKGEDTLTTQAYRFDKTKFIASEAKQWLKDHNIKYISFETASDTKDYNMKGTLITKDLESSIEDVTDEGIVSIYVNKFENVDAAGEISDTKSFNKTIADGIERIKHLKDHDQHKLLGLPIEIIPDSFGLLVRSAMNLKKDLAKDVFEDYKFFAGYKRTLEHSIGTIIVKQIPEGKYKRNLEYALYEYSTLSFLGANPETPLVSFKNDTMFQQLQMFNAMMKGNYTDERFKTIENTINLIKKSMENQMIVKCPCCGLIFDYNSCEERTVDTLVQEGVINYTRWIIEDVINQEMNKMRPDIQNQVMEIIKSTKGMDMEGMYNHVRCPKCYSIVTSKSLINSEPNKITPKDEPKTKIDLKNLITNLKIG